jgi:hypothetical protein
MIVIRTRDIAAEVPVFRIIVGASHWLPEWSRRFGRKGLRVRPAPAYVQGHLSTLPAPKFLCLGYIEQTTESIVIGLDRGIVRLRGRVQEAPAASRWRNAVFRSE